MTKDPWAGDLSRSGTLDPYVYVRNKPANCTNASGGQEEEDLYSSYESYRQSRELVSDWYHERGSVRCQFGPKESLTQEVRHDAAVQQFKNLWSVIRALAGVGICCGRAKEHHVVRIHVLRISFAAPRITVHGSPRDARHPAGCAGEGLDEGRKRYNPVARPPGSLHVAVGRSAKVSGAVLPGPVRSSGADIQRV